MDDEINSRSQPTNSCLPPQHQSSAEADARDIAVSRDALLSRRGLLAVSTTLTLGGFASMFGGSAKAREFDTSKIRALVFDVYGTCTDYWGTIVHEGQAINLNKKLEIDWARIATDWRGLFPPGFQAVLKGQRPWQSFASLRLEALRNVVQERGITGLSDEDLANINAVWQRVEPWQDTIPGLQRLKRRYTLASLSNADMADMVKLSKFRGLPWDVVLASELAQAVKPDPKTYQVAIRYLGLKPEEIMMVACHKADLLGAKAQGLRTAFVRRPLEAGPNAQVDIAVDDQFDLNAASFIELADLLGA